MARLFSHWVLVLGTQKSIFPVLTGLCICFSAWKPVPNLKCQLACSELSCLFIAGDFGQLILQSPLQDSRSHKFFTGFLNILRHLVDLNGLNFCYVCMRENEKPLHWRNMQGRIEFPAPGQVPHFLLKELLLIFR